MSEEKPYGYIDSDTHRHTQLVGYVWMLEGGYKGNPGIGTLFMRNTKGMQLVHTSCLFPLCAQYFHNAVQSSLLYKQTTT